MDERICTNCGEPVSRTYCGACSQRYVPLDTLGYQTLVGDYFRAAFEEFRWPRTLWTLVRYPGKLTTEYLSGRRRSQVNPLLLLFVLLSLSIWVTGFYTFTVNDVLDTVEQDLPPSMLDWVREFEKWGDLSKRLSTFAMGIVVNPFLFWLVLRRKEPRLFAHTIFALHLVSFTTLANCMTTLFVVLFYNTAESTTMLNRLGAGLWVVNWAYALVSARRFYELTWRKTLTANAAVFGFYCLGVMAIGIAIGLYLVQSGIGAEWLEYIKTHQPPSQ